MKAGLKLHKFHETKSHRSREELSFKQFKEDKVTRILANERHYCHDHDLILTELVLADVHQLLGGQEASVGAAPDVRLLLPARSEGLKGSIVNKLGLFHHLT